MIRITTAPAERKNVLQLHVDDEYQRDIHTSIFGKKPKFATTITQETWQPIFQELEYRAAYQYTLKCLSRQSLSTPALRQRLKERLVSSENIERIIDESIRLGYLNDNTWLEAYIKRQFSKKNGPEAIISKLCAKGFSRDLATDILSRIDNEELQIQRIQRLLETKYRKHDLSDYHTKQKVVAALARKGFSFDTILKALPD